MQSWARAFDWLHGKSCSLKEKMALKDESTMSHQRTGTNGMRTLISRHGWVDSWLRIQECLSCMAYLKAWNKEMYLGRQPKIYSTLWLGWSVWNQHYSCGNISLFSTSRRSWNGLWQTMKAGKTGLLYYLLNQMINFQGGLNVFYELFIYLQSFIPSGALSLFLPRKEIYPHFLKCIFEKLMKYLLKLHKSPKLFTGHQYPIVPEAEFNRGNISPSI